MSLKRSGRGSTSAGKTPQSLRRRKMATIDLVIPLSKQRARKRGRGWESNASSLLEVQNGGIRKALVTQSVVGKLVTAAVAVTLFLPSFDSYSALSAATSATWIRVIGLGNSSSSLDTRWPHSWFATVYSDRLVGFTVAFGVAGPTLIAFALQEVIASVAGWVAISLGSFYKPGDRVHTGR